MSSVLERSWPRAEPLAAALAVAAAVVVFAASWLLVQQSFWTERRLADTPVYQRYGERIVAGEVPYRDFAVEYPPGSLPAFVLPSLGNAQRSHDDYRQRFEVLMLACGGAMLALMAVALVGLAAGAPRLGGALVFAAAAPVLLGPVLQTRFDLWPAAITAGALAAFVWERPRLGFALLGLGAVIKVYPAVLLPLALAYEWRRSGRRAVLAGAAVFAAAVVVVALPFAAVSPGGLWGTVQGQLERPLQIESLGAALLVAVHLVGDVPAVMRTGYGSQNLVGGTPDAIAAAQAALQALAVAALAVAFARRRRTADELVAWSAASVCAFVALGKVLSPQFLIWLLPLVPLVGGRRGVAASALLGGALLLTQAWIPDRYWDYALRFDELPAALVLGRDVVLLALAAVLVAPRRRVTVS